MNEFEQIKNEFDSDYEKITNEQELENARVKFLGKKGVLTNLMPKIKEIANELKKEFGQNINKTKNYIEEKIAELKAKQEKAKIDAEIKNSPAIDITMPTDTKTGSLHPRTIIQKEIEDAFISMGFIIEDGDEIQTEYNNFDAVNVPATHPARDMQDTFWLNNGELLRTQTSSLQNMVLKKYGAPSKVLMPGRCFRNEELDASHENTFFQVEGVVTGENISVANLLYFIKQMLKGVFKKDIEIRCRPGFFPFTEPSFEVDAKCPFCGGKGCATCKGGGWIELCPCGMIHPNVLEMGGIDTEKYNGFAFGLGFDRLVMIKSGLKDIRGLNSGDLKILKQFGTKM